MSDDFCYDVVAIDVDEHGVNFLCPQCVDKIKKDGTPYKNAKPNWHRHGNLGRMDNHNFITGAHCIEKYVVDKDNYKDHVRVHITDNTKRVYRFTKNKHK